MGAPGTPRFRPPQQQEGAWAYAVDQVPRGGCRPDYLLATEYRACYRV